MLNLRPPHVSLEEATDEYWTRKRILSWVLMVGIAIAAIRYFNKPSGPATIHPEDIQQATVPPRLDGTHPCVFASLSGSTMTTGLGQCATPTEPHGATDRFEVDLRYGAFVLRQSDLLLNDVFDAPFTRAYFSSDWVAANPVHAFGLKTNHSYDIALVGTRKPYTYMMLLLEDGDFLYFKRISAGTGFEDAVFLHTETSTRFYKSTIAWNSDGWTLRLADGSQFLFPEAYLSKNLAQTAPYQATDAAGNKLLFQRNTARDLEQVLTPHGHWIRFQHDPQSRIIQAQDDAGNSVHYGYNDDGLLAFATHSSGASRAYEYQGQLMRAVRDEHGQTLVRNWYESGRLIRQQYANGDTYQFEYNWRPQQSHMDAVTVTLPDHSAKRIVLTNSIPDRMQ
jgi:YD repeat-containing protein